MSSRIFSKKIYSGVAAVILAMAAPNAAHAAPLITEIMYDVPGADSGHEWIEVTGIGADSIDLGAKDMRLVTKSGAHKVTGYAGASTVLRAGMSVVIADKPAVFLLDHPGFQGVVLDSALTLTAADALSIRQTEGAVLDTISYTSDMGGKGDGASLQRVGSGLRPGVPTPGSYDSRGPRVQPAAPALGTSKQQASTPAHTTTARNTAISHEKGIGAPAARATTRAAGAAVASVSGYGLPPIFSSPYVAAFLALLVFSAISLIVIRIYV